MTAPELKPCSSCHGEKRFLDTTYDRCGVMVDCARCYATGLSQGAIQAILRRTATIPDPLDDPRVVALVACAQILRDDYERLLKTCGWPIIQGTGLPPIDAALSDITKEPPHER